MENNRSIFDCVILHDTWGRAVQEVLVNAVTLEDQAEIFGQELIGQVIRGVLDVDELRVAVRWVNALDREVVELGVDMTQTSEDGREAIARRLAHHAGRTALSKLKTERRRLNTYVAIARG